MVDPAVDHRGAYLYSQWLEWLLPLGCSSWTGVNDMVAKICWRRDTRVHRPKSWVPLSAPSRNAKRRMSSCRWLMP